MAGNLKCGMTHAMNFNVENWGYRRDKDKKIELHRLYEFIYCYFASHNRGALLSGR